MLYKDPGCARQAAVGYADAPSVVAARLFEGKQESMARGSILALRASCFVVRRSFCLAGCAWAVQD
jgi:hypothetical protein